VHPGLAAMPPGHKKMLRVNSTSVLFVPPFECAWLSELRLEEGGGCLSFEAKGMCALCKRQCAPCPAGMALQWLVLMSQARQT